MAADAEIGDAGVDEPDQADVSRTVVEAYREVADAKRTLPEALAIGMIDPAVEVLQVESDGGLQFMLSSDFDEFSQNHEVINKQTLVAPGSLAKFTGREGRQFGFVKYLADDRAAVAKALSVPVDSLEENQALLSDWKPVMLDVRGEVTASSASQFKTLLGNQLGGGANWIGVRIDSVGGDLAACIDLANKLAELDPNSVRVVAYVPVEARGGAAIIALACDQVVMHPDATIGIGPEARLPQADDNRQLPPPPRRGRRPQPPPEFRDDQAAVASAVTTIRESLGVRADRPWSLLAAMVDPGIEVFQFRSKATGEERLMSAEEAAAEPDAGNWTRGASLHARNEPLAIRGTQAVKLGLAWQNVDNFDQLERLYGIEIPTVEPNWALKLVHALASPGLATFLLFLGLIGMYVELKTPGVGVGGVVAATAFILFFWSKYLNQTATELEIILFVSGVVLMLIEIFVVPGVGVFGLAGGLMVIFSLVLASQTFIVPRSEADLNELRNSITVVAAAGLGMMGLAFATRKYLPKAPLFNRLVLEPPPPEERITLSHREALADYTHLIGVAGEAVTDLRPAGRALVSGQIIDVIAEGVPLDRGTPIVVVAAHAHRVLVRAAT
jgi:membrane-bound serine protease (ClpP class)